MAVGTIEPPLLLETMFDSESARPLRCQGNDPVHGGAAVLRRRTGDLVSAPRLLKLAEPCCGSADPWSKQGFSFADSVPLCSFLAIASAELALLGFRSLAAIGAP